MSRSFLKPYSPAQAEIERALRKDTDGNAGNTTGERMEILSERRRNATVSLLGPPADELRDGGDTSIGGRGDAREVGTSMRTEPTPQTLHLAIKCTISLRCPCGGCLECA